jgi:hypothetical protein
MGLKEDTKEIGDKRHIEGMRWIGKGMERQIDRKREKRESEYDRYINERDRQT